MGCETLITETMTAR